MERLTQCAAVPPWLKSLYGTRGRRWRPQIRRLDAHRWLNASDRVMPLMKKGPAKDAKAAPKKAAPKKTAPEKTAPKKRAPMSEISREKARLRKATPANKLKKKLFDGPPQARRSQAHLIYTRRYGAQRIST